MEETPRSVRRERSGGFILGDVASERDEAKKPLCYKIWGSFTTLGGFLFNIVQIIYIYIYIYLDP